MARTSSFSYAFLTDILSSPKIKPLAQRLHPSAVLGVLKNTFDDVSQELWSAVSEQRRPDVGELIERIVERLRELVGISEPLVVDARGRLFPNDYPRLASAALEEGSWILCEPQTDYSRRQDELREKEARAKLARLGGAEAAAVFANCGAARIAVLHALSSTGRGLVVARRDMYERENGERLEESFDAFPTLPRREIGACNSVTLDDYARACDASVGLVWRSFGRWLPRGRRPSDAEIAGLKETDGRSFLLLGEIEFAPLINLNEFFDASVPTVAERLKSGFDLVLCGGAQLIGGPPVGLLFGSRSSIDAVLRAPMSKYAKASRVGLAALTKTLSLYDDRTVALESIPVLRALSTSDANLLSRAKRLAQILETYDFVQFARAIEGRAILCPDASFGTTPSRVVEVKPRGFSAAELAAKFEKLSPKLLVRWTKDSVLIDMKTLPPEQDPVVGELFDRIARPDALDILPG